MLKLWRYSGAKPKVNEPFSPEVSKIDYVNKETFVLADQRGPFIDSR